MLIHSSPPTAHHLATIVLQDAGCTIVDEPEDGEAELGREGWREAGKEGGQGEGGVGNDVATATGQEQM